MILDITVLSLSAFVGNVGVALTGFGMAIVYLFVWQIAVLSGYESDFKYAIFVQSIALLAAQPLLLYKANVFEHASWRMLRYFLPVTIVATPLGQLLGDNISTDTVEAVGGVLVSLVAVFEVYQKRQLFIDWLLCRCGGRDGDVATDENITNKAALEDSKKVPSNTSMTTNSFSDGEGFSDKKLSDEYDLMSVLGEGCFAIVKSGVNKATGKRVAVKSVVKAQLLTEAELKLLEEIKIMRELNHPNIVGLYTVYDEPEHYHLVMPIMGGGDLFSRLAASSVFTEKYSRFVCKSILGALSYMHSKQIAHRDLKPENILMESEREESRVKLADLGFAKKETTPNSFTTMCGTPAYVAPEIIMKDPYGLPCDMWSLGVLTFIMMGGYQPFPGETDAEVEHKIKAGDFTFDDKYFDHVTPDSKAFVRMLLDINPGSRPNASACLGHSWFKARVTDAVKKEDPLVFFMVGSQRSGSNWLRTMLDEREDLAGPHPPHMMRDFAPHLDRYGELCEEDNFRVLVDHVSTFVERNQVPWTDKHGTAIVFPRVHVFETALASSKRVLEQRASAGNMDSLPNTMYLLCVFDAIMNFYTKANGKNIWMCKSMGMSKFHDLLLEFYGSQRLRYIYLVRDPRDVAMSFMKTPVGDCHYYSIVKKWTNLQRHAIRIHNECPELMLKVHYEDILKEKAKVVKGIYDFIGERRFGGIKRQASVMFMNPTEDLINGAKGGREAEKARHLSYQFQNLGRGESFAKVQLAKWKDPKLGLSDEAIEIIESVAHEVMSHFGYATHLVGVSMNPKSYTDEQLQAFLKLNQEGIDKMNADLKLENPGDYERRTYQAEALKLPIELFGDWTISDQSMSSTEDNSDHFLTEEDLELRLSSTPTGMSTFDSGRTFRYATATQRGYYPHEHDKPNQDRAVAKTDIGQSTNGKAFHYFACFDGHGPDGHLCADMASTTIPSMVGKAVCSGTANVRGSVEKAHLCVHDKIVAADDIQDKLSGTTATSVLMYGDGKCLVANVGDSTCIAGSVGNDGVQTTKRWCLDHTPMRADERERITKAGGVIMTVEERDGLVPLSDDWSESDAPPRVWSQEDDKFPGCGFTRSLGDSIAHTLGVSACPELFEQSIGSTERVLIVASDGVTEFLDDDECLKIVLQHPMDPAAAARALVKEASKTWLDRGDYMDDITAAVVFFDQDSEQVDVEAGTINDSADSEVLKDNCHPLSAWARFWTLFAGLSSGFLGGLCGIRGPPIILYFLHTPKGVQFNKNSQRATGAAITATNVLMRVAYYLVQTFALGTHSNFRRDDWGLYIAIVCCSIAGVFLGSKIFELLKDSKGTIRAVLTIFLLLCGVSLLISSFSHV